MNLSPISSFRSWISQLFSRSHSGTSSPLATHIQNSETDHATKTKPHSWVRQQWNSLYGKISSIWNKQIGNQSQLPPKNPSKEVSFVQFVDNKNHTILMQWKDLPDQLKDILKKPPFHEGFTLKKEPLSEQEESMDKQHPEKACLCTVTASVDQSDDQKMNPVYPKKLKITDNLIKFCFTSSDTLVVMPRSGKEATAVKKTAPLLDLSEIAVSPEEIEKLYQEQILKNETLQNRVKALEDQLQTKQDELLSDQKFFAETEKDLQETIKQQQTELKKLLTNNTSILNELETFRKDCEKQKQLIKTLEEQHHANGRTIEALLEEKRDLNDRLEKSKIKFSDLFR